MFFFPVLQVWPVSQNKNLPDRSDRPGIQPRTSLQAAWFIWKAFPMSWAATTTRPALMPWWSQPPFIWDSSMVNGPGREFIPCWSLLSFNAYRTSIIITSTCWVVWFPMFNIRINIPLSRRLEWLAHCNSARSPYNPSKHIDCHAIQPVFFWYSTSAARISWRLCKRSAVCWPLPQKLDLAWIHGDARCFNHENGDSIQP